MSEGKQPASADAPAGPSPLDLPSLDPGHTNELVKGGPKNLSK
jgi:hypothetical protein